MRLHQTFASLFISFLAVLQAADSSEKNPGAGGSLSLDLQALSLQLHKTGLEQPPLPLPLSREHSRALYPR